MISEFWLLIDENSEIIKVNGGPASQPHGASKPPQWLTTTRLQRI
jgi:hypothetical protein